MQTGCEKYGRAEQKKVLSIDGLKVEFRSMGNTVYAVNGVSLEVKQGETRF